jgi:hypothetical protein
MVDFIILEKNVPYEFFDEFENYIIKSLELAGFIVGFLEDGDDYEKRQVLTRIDAYDCLDGQPAISFKQENGYWVTFLPDNRVFIFKPTGELAVVFKMTRDVYIGRLFKSLLDLVGDPCED